MKKLFNRELVMNKEDEVHFKSSNKSWICDNAYVDGDFKVRDQCHITGKYSIEYRVSAHRDCNIIVKLNHKIPVVFHQRKNYNSYVITQELQSFS